MIGLDGARVAAATEALGQTGAVHGYQADVAQVAANITGQVLVIDGGGSVVGH